MGLRNALLLPISHLSRGFAALRAVRLCLTDYASDNFWRLCLLLSRSLDTERGLPGKAKPYRIEGGKSQGGQPQPSAFREAATTAGVASGLPTL